MAGLPLFPVTTKEDISNAKEVTPGEPVQRETNVATLVRPAPLSGPTHSTETIESEQTVVQLPPSYSWGSPSKGNWVATDSTDKVNVGDVLRFRQRLRIPFLETWQTDHAIAAFRKDARFELLYFALNEETRTLVIEARARSSFSPVPLIAAAVVIILATAFIWVTTESVEKLGTVTVAGTKLNLVPLVGIGIVAVLLLGAFAKVRAGAGD